MWVSWLFSYGWLITLLAAQVFWLSALYYSIPTSCLPIFIICMVKICFCLFVQSWYLLSSLRSVEVISGMSSIGFHVMSLTYRVRSYTTPKIGSSDFWSSVTPVLQLALPCQGLWYYPAPDFYCNMQNKLQQFYSTTDNISLETYQPAFHLFSPFSAVH